MVEKQPSGNPGLDAEIIATLNKDLAAAEDRAAQYESVAQDYQHTNDRLRSALDKTAQWFHSVQHTWRIKTYRECGVLPCPDNNAALAEEVKQHAVG